LDGYKNINHQMRQLASPGNLQAVFGHHISHAKRKHDLNFLTWGEAPACLLTPPSGNSSLWFHLLV